MRYKTRTGSLVFTMPKNDPYSLINSSGTYYACGHYAIKLTPRLMQRIPLNIERHTDFPDTLHELVRDVLRINQTFYEAYVQGILIWPKTDGKLVEAVQLRAREQYAYLDRTYMDLIVHNFPTAVPYLAETNAHQTAILFIDAGEIVGVVMPVYLENPPNPAETLLDLPPFHV